MIYKLFITSNRIFQQLQLHDRQDKKLPSQLKWMFLSTIKISNIILAYDDHLLSNDITCQPNSHNLIRKRFKAYIMFVYILEMYSLLFAQNCTWLEKLDAWLRLVENSLKLTKLNKPKLEQNFKLV